MEYYKIRIFLYPLIVKEPYYHLAKSKGHYHVLTCAGRTMEADSHILAHWCLCGFLGTLI